MRNGAMLAIGAIGAGLLWLAMPVLAQDAHPHHGPPDLVAAAAQGTAAAPVFSPKAGTYTAPLAVTITTATAGAKIYYTTDGSNPSRKTSPVYTGPVQLTAKTTLKAISYKKGLKTSGITRGVYKLSAPPPPPSETGGTLFLATLTPQSGASSGGSGSSTLTLTKDQKAAVLRFSFSSSYRPDHQPAHPRLRRDDPLRHRHDAAAGRRIAGLAHPVGRHLRHGGDPRRAAGRRVLPQPPYRSLSGG